MDTRADSTAPPERRHQGAFTRYLRELEEKGEPDRESFLELWRALEAALVHELRRRSLRSSPPSYLGIFGWESWQAKERGPGRTASALEELMVDCYTQVFLRRLPRLRAHLATKPDVEGIVFRYLRNFVHDRQRENDPLGYRIYEVLHDAVEDAVESGELFVIRGDERRIRNATVLGVTPGETGESSDASSLRPLVARWNDDLLPELVTAGGAGRPKVVARLRRRLLDLEPEGVRSVRFQDLLNPLKDDVRRRWADLFDLEEGEATYADDEAGGEVVRIFRPEHRLEETESFNKLVGCVSDLLETLEELEGDRRHLTKLWRFLRTYSGGEGPEKMPSRRKLSGLLRIPRQYFPSLYATLGRLIDSCREILSGRKTPGASTEGAAS